MSNVTVLVSSDIDPAWQEHHTTFNEIKDELYNYFSVNQVETFFFYLNTEARLMTLHLK